ncbi:MAG TPA: heparinase II/III family protein [Chloroflexota bacterium]|nr:heparinase II/III family protein [Chloroflexota bacterium]
MPLAAHPVTIYKAEQIARARENVARHAWARRVVEGLRERVALTLEGGAAFVEGMIPATTPTGVGFTNCAACGANAIHGAYDWDPRDPERLVCTTCRIGYPNERYPEDVEFRASRHGESRQRGGGGTQIIGFHGGYRYDFRGFALYSSWSGQIRARKVGYMAGQAQALATLYAATGDPGCAAAAGAILRRFAAVYPAYLVHSSYGEWIDLPPRVVAERINDLPEDEWTIPPNKPDRKLHSGYWNSGRATGSGMEGSFIRQLVVAYDLVRDALSADEREAIERDVLRESVPLLLADPAKNNKSVANLTAAGMVGMVVDDAALVRAGAEGFWHFVRRWFLADGTTSESPAYGLMTLNGLWSFGEALHGYVDAERGETVDVYGDAAYRAVFRGLYETLLPNLRYPAFADSYVTTAPGAQYVELMAARYGLPEYRALLAEVHGGSFDEAGGEYALFNRDPDLALRPGDRVMFGDVFFPELRLGYLRAGEDGRAATAILSASHWGVHHHRDSLNLTFFQRGHEVLTDLGYLWDRPDKEMTVRSAAHNLVVVDEAEQRTTERGGTRYAFESGERVKVVECSSEAYAQAPVYRRRCVLVDDGAAGAYLVDVFWVRGGATHDYLFHGPVPGYTPEGLSLVASSGPAPYGLADMRRGRVERASGAWRLTWALEGKVHFAAWAVAVDEEEVLVGNGWGERGWGHFNTPDKKVSVPYVVRRRTGDNLASTFVSVFEAYEGAPRVRGVRLAGGGAGAELEVERAGGVDRFSLEPGGAPLSVGRHA